MEIRDLVKALLAYDAIAARQWIADCERAKVAWSNIPMPENVSAEELSLAAAVAELMAERSGSPAPKWTRDISANARGVFLVRAAKNMRGNYVKRKAPSLCAGVSSLHRQIF